MRWLQVAPSWENTVSTFACHDKSCAPPPAGHGGSSPVGAVSRVGVGHSWVDHTHGHVTVTNVQSVVGKNYDRVTVKSTSDGSTHDVFLGTGGAAKRLVASRTITPRIYPRRRFDAPPHDPNNSDDGYDALKDARLTDPIFYRPSAKRYTRFK